MLSGPNYNSFTTFKTGVTLFFIYWYIYFALREQQAVNTMYDNYHLIKMYLNAFNENGVQTKVTQWINVPTS